MNTKQNKLASVKFDANIKSLQREVSLIKSALYQTRDTINSLGSDMDNGSSGEVHLNRLYLHYKNAVNQIDLLKSFADRLFIEGEYKNADFFEENKSK